MTMSKQFLSLVLILFTVISVGCRKTEPATTTNAGPPPPTKPPPSPLHGFDADLQFIKNGGYSYIYVFSRKDGNPLEPDDSQYLRTNAPQMVDWVRTREGKAVIGGTNFNLEEGNLGLLQKRFVVEDYSGR